MVEAEMSEETEKMKIAPHKVGAVGGRAQNVLAKSSKQYID